MKKTFWGFIALLLTATGYGTYKHFGAAQPITLENAQQIVWKKPTTDAGWAKDVKAENFDIKSTKALEDLRGAQTAKLQEQQADDKPISCPDCLRYDFQQQFARQGISGKELDAEVENATQTTIKQYLWEKEKIEQSIERINHELDLRARGYVVVQGDPKAKGVPADRIRTIHD